MIAQHYFNYIDSDEDFIPGEEVTGTFVDFQLEWCPDPGYALLDLDDGRKTRLSMHYLRQFSDAAYKLKEGDRLTLKKLGFSSKRQHTAWQIVAMPVRVHLALPKEVIDKQRYVAMPLMVKTRWLELDSDFDYGVVEEASIAFFYGSKRFPLFAIVEMSDGAVSRVSAESFHKCGKDIRDYRAGDTLRLMKTGFIPYYRITNWLILN